jgi:hypothetical protein
MEMLEYCSLVQHLPGICIVPGLIPSSAKKKKKKERKKETRKKRKKFIPRFRVAVKIQGSVHAALECMLKKQQLFLS